MNNSPTVSCGCHRYY